MPQDDQSGTRGRRRNAPAETGVFAADVICALKDLQTLNHDGARQFVLDHLVRAILLPKEFNVVALCEDLLNHRLKHDAIIDLYIPSAARCLGESWVQNNISFADVTIGTLRLQSLLDQVVQRSKVDFSARTQQTRALLVLPEGEQHFLGLSVVAAQLRRVGCEVLVSFDETLEALEQRVSTERPHIVLISCSRSEALEAITQIVQTIRSATNCDPMFVLGGAVMIDTEDLIDRTGVDLVSADAKDAIALCSERLKSSVRQ